MIVISETDPRFYIKDSSIEGAGSGVFSKKKHWQNLKIWKKIWGRQFEWF